MRAPAVELASWYFDWMKQLSGMDAVERTVPEQLVTGLFRVEKGRDNSSYWSQFDGLRADFRQFIDAHADRYGFSSQDFARDNLVGGSFGGRLTRGQKIKHQPVVFINGSGDRALMGSNVPSKFGEWPAHPGVMGWFASVRAFTDAGYTPAELYGITVGPGDAAHGHLVDLQTSEILRVRRFLEAVLDYTGADQVDVMGHSKGVLIARRALKGGKLFDEDSQKWVDLGPPLGPGEGCRDKVDTFLGIAGPNHGINWGAFTPFINQMSPARGMHPEVPFLGGLSDFLAELNADPHREARHVFSIGSHFDQVLMGNLTWNFGETSDIPGQDGRIIYNDPMHEHLGCNYLTTREQIELVTEHQLSAAPLAAQIDGIPIKQK